MFFNFKRRKNNKSQKPITNSRKKEYITRMYVDILFDRDINEEEHYISPGMYEIIDKRFRPLSFDFKESYKTIDENNNRLMHIEVRYVDLTEYSETKDLIEYVENIDHFSLFYIYTGEKDDPEIDPVEVRNVCFETNLDRRIDIDDICLSKINAYFELNQIIKKRCT